MADGIFNNDLDAALVAEFFDQRSYQMQARISKSNGRSDLRLIWFTNGVQHDVNHRTMVSRWRRGVYRRARYETVGRILEHYDLSTYDFRSWCEERQLDPFAPGHRPSAVAV